MNDCQQEIQDQQVEMFHPEGLSQGRIARLNGASEETANPYDPLLDEWMYQSFLAGWHEADNAFKTGEVK